MAGARAGVMAGAMAGARAGASASVGELRRKLGAATRRLPPRQASPTAGYSFPDHYQEPWSSGGREEEEKRLFGAVFCSWFSSRNH
jgi:hypothetical protein